MKQAFYDDRKGRAIVDERERIVRAAVEARRAAGGSATPERPSKTAVRRPKRMPGSGHTLSGDVIVADEEEVDGDERMFTGEEDEGDEVDEEGEEDEKEKE